MIGNTFFLQMPDDIAEEDRIVSNVQGYTIRNRDLARLNILTDLNDEVLQCSILFVCLILAFPC